ncbi:MAG: BlaI/MecI/CopY family transcriptional regulator [FCB group bacterium]|jgi:BlaI family penicillinase repressor|nr:BlaI/MecI/CopY family transcriptional regulator [FCB group bacterium]
MDAKEPSHPDLSGAEWKVMKAVWTLKKANVRDVYERLQGQEGWAYNTVRTLMDRLCVKGYLKAEKAGNLYVYKPTKTRRSVSAQALWAFVEKVFDGAVGPLVTQLIEEDKLSQEDLEKLRGILDEERNK